jgi:hypothetical protein
MMIITPKGVEGLVKAYVKYLSPAAFTVRGPAFKPVQRQVVERCGDSVEVRAWSVGSIEAAIISSATPPRSDHLQGFVPLDLVLGWRGLAEPLGRMALGRVRHSYPGDGQRLVATEQPADLPWLLASLCFAPGCPPLSLDDDCRPGRVLQLHGYEVDILTPAGVWRCDAGERCTLIWVTSWRFFKWWGSSPGDALDSSEVRAKEIYQFQQRRIDA